MSAQSVPPPPSVPDAGEGMSSLSTDMRSLRWLAVLQPAVIQVSGALLQTGDRLSFEAWVRLLSSVLSAAVRRPVFSKWSTPPGPEFRPAFGVLARSGSIDGASAVMLAIDEATGRAIADAVTSDLFALRGFGPLTDAELGVLEFVTLSALDAVVRSADPVAASVRLFGLLSRRELSEWRMAHSWPTGGLVVRGIMVPVRRLVRWAFNLAAILSLLACTATGALWLRSYRVSDGFVYSRHGNLSFGRSVRGRIGVITVYGIAKADVFTRIEWAYLVDWYSEPVFVPGAIGAGVFPSDSDFHFLGIAVVGGTQDYLVSKNPMTLSTYSSRLVVVPFWLPCFIMAWPIYVLLIRRMKRIRVGYANGLCRSCGYDLRATPGRCPECGRVPNGRAST